MMKKLVISVLSALLLISAFSSCGPKNSNVSPGDLSTPTQQPTPHVSTGETDVSSDYFARLCTDLWLDTITMHCCSLNEDGTYYWMQSKKDPKQIASGNWRLTLDDQKFLTLYLTDSSSGKAQVLHEIELYESSIYAADDEGNGIVWLMTERDKASDD